MLLQKIYWKIKKNIFLKRNKNISKNIILEDFFDINKPENLLIEDYVYIGPYCWFDARGGLTIKRGAILGPRVKIHTFNHNYLNCSLLPYDEKEIKKPVVIEDNVWIGSDVIILPGSIICEGAIVSSGSVVRGKLDFCGIYSGNPAKIIKYRDIDQYLLLKSKDSIYIKNKMNLR